MPTCGRNCGSSQRLPTDLRCYFLVMLISSALFLGFIAYRSFGTKTQENGSFGLPNNSGNKSKLKDNPRMKGEYLPVVSNSVQKTDKNKRRRGKKQKNQVPQDNALNNDTKIENKSTAALNKQENTKTQEKPSETQEDTVNSGGKIDGNAGAKSGGLKTGSNVSEAPLVKTQCVDKATESGEVKVLAGSEAKTDLKVAATSPEAAGEVADAKNPCSCDSSTRA